MRHYSNPRMLPVPDRATVIARLFLALVICGGLLWGAFAEAQSTNVLLCTDESVTAGSAQGACAVDGVVYSSSAEPTQWFLTCRGSGLTDPSYDLSTCPLWSWRLGSTLVVGDYLYCPGPGQMRSVTVLGLSFEISEGGGDEDPPPSVNLLGIPNLTAAEWGSITQAVLGLFVTVAVISLIRKTFFH